MGLTSKYMAITVVVLLVVAGIAGYFIFTSSMKSSMSTSCKIMQPANDQELSNVSFNAVTEFLLPSSTRNPNAIAVNQTDGSVWFGNNALPGVDHLYANGTLMEYPIPFPRSPDSVCGMFAYIFGVALWNGGVWIADEDYSGLLEINPATGAITNLALQSGAQPYTLTVGPDDYLWFTQLFQGPEVGKVTPGIDAIAYYGFPGNSTWEPAYLLFQNSTVGYLLADNVNPTSLNDYTVNSQIYSFNPASPSPTFQALGSNATLYYPSGLALGDGGLWITQHDATAMAFYNFTTSKFAIYPLSSVPFIPTDLSYFDVWNGSAVWFNEHFANRMGVISGNGNQLTEYSLSSPPASNLSNIDNAITIAMGKGVVWFTGLTANVVGFVNESYVPQFSVSVVGNSTLQIPAGGSKQIQIQLSGPTNDNLSLQFSDDEAFDAIPAAITFTPSANMTSLSGTQTVHVNISVASNLKSGDYIAAITVTDGLIFRSVYLNIAVI